MKSLIQLFHSEPVLSAKSIKRAGALINGIISEDIKTSICEFSTLFFNSDSKYVPSSLIKQVTKQFEAHGIFLAFQSLSDSLIATTFWTSENPNLSAFMNYTNISGDACFDGHEVDFLFILCKFLFTFPAQIFVDLYHLIELYLDHINKLPTKFDVPQELLQYVDDAYDKQVVYTILSTQFIKFSDRKIPVSQLSTCYKISVLCLEKGFPKEEMPKLRANSSILFSVSLKPEQYLLLQSYFALSIESQNIFDVLIGKITQLLTESSDQSIFECVYAAYLNAFGLPQLPQFLHFLIRDFDNSYDEVRHVLMHCFNKIYEIDAEEVTKQLTPLFIGLLWNSKLKRFAFPFLLKIGNEDLFRELVDMAQDPQMKPFVMKCICNVTNFDLFQKVIENTKIDLTESLISFENIFVANSNLAKTCVQNTNLYNVRFDAAIANPKLFASSITNEDLELGRKSFNWDLRIKCVAVFVAAGFPKSDNDAQRFVDSIPSLLIIDNPDHQSRLIKLMEDLMELLGARKYETVNKNEFAAKLISKISPYLLPTNSSMMRQNALTILESVWKRFPLLPSENDKTNLLSTLEEGCISLKKLAFATLKLLNLSTDKNDDEIILNNTISKLPNHDNLDDLHRFSMLLSQKGIVNNLNGNHIIELIKIKLDDWEMQCEIFHIICLLCTNINVSNEIIEKATDYIFISLVNSRKPGLVTKSYSYLSQLIKKLVDNSRQSGNDSSNLNAKPKEYCKQLISLMADFDMAQMRRSASLPFISVALIKGCSEIFDELTNNLIEICLTSTNSNEIANSLNSLNLIVKECSACTEEFFGALFATIFKCSAKYPSKWDVICAADLAYNALLHKIWTYYAKENTFRGFSRCNFMSKIKNSKETIIEALNCGISHSIYIALLLFTMFPRDAGDSEFLPIILSHKNSKFSRIRRTAVRALINVISVDKKDFTFDVNEKDSNEKHFLAMFTKEMGKSNNESSYSSLRKVYPLLFSPNLESPILVDRCLALKNWPNPTAPEKVQRKLIADLFVFEGKVDITYQTEGLDFLIRTLPLNFIENSELHTICECYKNAKTIEIKALFLKLFRFVENPNVDEIADDLGDAVSDPSQIALHHAASTIVHILVERKMKVVLLYLVLNDVPIIRKRTSIAFSSYSSSSSGYFLNEIEIANQLIAELDEKEKKSVLKHFLDIIKPRIDADMFGEPLTFTVDEFFIVFKCFENIRKKFFNIASKPLPLIEMRKTIYGISNEEYNLK